MNITVVGLGYVGTAIAQLVQIEHEVIGLDSNLERVLSIKEFEATTDREYAYKNSEMIFVCGPTDYNEEKNYFDTSVIESIIEDIEKYKPDAIICIKSTIPVGFTDKMRAKYPDMIIIFSPEFLREGKALHDVLYPSRIIIGDNSYYAHQIADVLGGCCNKPDVQILYTGTKEAEAIKLFANTYLANRVAFFNELDSYAMQYNLDAKQIIDGVCSDNRIGKHYNNPSFGYGGYCLPKDTKQLRANFHSVPEKLMTAIIESNETRKDFICQQILARKPQTVGIYRLVMKHGSDNFRHSAIIGVIGRLEESGINCIIFEPECNNTEKDLETFKNKSDVIICNRMYDELEDVKHKVFTRDIFGRD